MNDQRKTKAQLLVELAALRRRVADLEDHALAPETEPQSVDETILASQQNLAALIENTDGSIWSVDTHYRLIVANELYHHNVSAALGRRLLTGESVLQPAFPPAALAEWQGYYDRALHGEHFSVKRYTRFARQSRYFEYRFSPITLADGTLGGATVFGRDITVAQQAEEQLRESESRHRVVAELMSDYVYAGVVYRDGRAQTDWISGAFERITGYTPDEIQQLPGGFASLLVTEDLAGLLAQQPRLFDGEAITVEYRIRNRAGEIRWLRDAMRPDQPVGDSPGVKLIGAVQDITERKLAEAALRASEERLRTVADFTYDWEYWVRSDRQIIYTSPSCERITGYNAAEFQADASLLDRVVHPDDHAVFQQHRAQQFTDEQACTIDFRIVTKGGEVRWINHVCQAVYDSAGRSLGRRASNRDITDRKQAEAAVRQSEERLRSFVQYAPIGLGVLDRDFRYLALNDTLAEFNDLPVAAHLGQPLAVVKPSVAQRLEPLLRQILATGQPLLNIDQLKPATAEGRAARYFVMSIFPILDAHGAIGALGLAVVDVTERRQIEENLARSEAKFRGAFDQSPVGAALVSLDKRFISCNAAFCRFLDYTEAELIGQTVADITYPADRSIGMREVQQIAQSQLDSATVQKRYVRKDGTLVWGEVTISLVRDVAGQPLYFLPIIQDITTRRQAEEQQRQSEAKFRAFVEQSSEGVVITDEQGRIIEWNRAVEHISGLRRDAVLGGTFWEIQAQLSPGHSPTAESSDRFRAMVAAALSSGQAAFFGQAVEAKIQTAAGERKSIRQLSFPIKTDDGYRIGALVQDVTERKQAEEALRASEEKYRLLVDTASEGIWAMDRDHRTTYVNQAMAEMLGYRPSEMLGRPVEDFFFAEDMAFHDQRMARRHAGQDEVYERRFKRRDGSSLWTLVSARATKDAAGEFSGSFAMMTDITERRRGEEERLAHFQFVEHLDRINRAMQGANDLDLMMSDVLDVVLSIFECDRAALVYPCDPVTSTWWAPMERTRPEYPGAHALNLEIPMDSDVVRVFQTVLASDDPVGFGAGNECALPAAVAEQFSEQAQLAMAIYPKAGSPYMFVVHQCAHPRVWSLEEKILLKEIGHRLADGLTSLQAQRKLRDSEARARAMLNAIPDLMFRLDRAGVFLDYKADVRELAAQTEPTLIGLRNRDISPAAFADLIDTQIAATLSTGTPHTFEYQLEIPDQGVHDYEARMVPSGADEVVSIVRDITARKQSEAQIRQLNAELENRVAQRTAQLAAANDRLLDLDRLKSKFVSDVSHELRTPVTSLSLFIDLLEHGKPEKRERYVAGLKDQMARLHKLINDILDLSRLERDRDEGGRSPVDINSIVEHVSAMERLTAEAAGLMLTCEVADNLPAVVARPDQLTRALTNLVSNAIKYTPTGAVRVQTHAQAGRVCIEVCDTGLGIPADELQHVFERFYRGHAVSQSTIPGTGLGLSIVKEIIESHGGTVDVQSELGQGSVFRIWLPIA